MKFLKIIFNRIAIIGVILLLQVSWFLLFIWKLASYSILISLVFQVLSAVVVLFIISKKDNPAIKLAWVVPILLFPLLGGLLYLFFGGKEPAKRIRTKLEKVYKVTDPLFRVQNGLLDEIRGLDDRVAGQMAYLEKEVGYPVYDHTFSEYYPMGELLFEKMMEEMEKAEHYIFLEYFIVEDGVMWQRMLELLKRKAAAGLDIRLMYDDVGSLFTLPGGYDRELEKYGIKCFVFNPFVPVLSVVMNNRDHRKILVIDGHTAFSGGINLADEYINVKHKLGVWKDTGIMLKGAAVWSFTLMFLQMWNAFRPTDTEYEKYRPEVYNEEKQTSDGYVQPYGDSPLDEEITGEYVYMNIINQARRYVFLFTPYLITDNEMVTALTMAAKRGVDVRIITPGIPDKKMVFWQTQSYYRALIDEGVQIYEFKPGFVHAKCFVCDDEIATVGTINMDYRSLYLHFECGVYFYRAALVMEVKEDILNTLKQCKKITETDCNKNRTIRLCQTVLRLFAPLM